MDDSVRKEARKFNYVVARGHLCHLSTQYIASKSSTPRPPWSLYELGLIVVRSC